VTFVPSMVNKCFLGVTKSSTMQKPIVGLVLGKKEVIEGNKGGSLLEYLT